MAAGLPVVEVEERSSTCLSWFSPSSRSPSGMAANYAQHRQPTINPPIYRTLANLSLLPPVSSVPSLTMPTSLDWTLCLLVAASQPPQPVKHPPRPDQQSDSAQRDEEREDHQHSHGNGPVVEVVTDGRTQTLTSNTNMKRGQTHARPVKLASKVSSTEYTCSLLVSMVTLE